MENSEQGWKTNTREILYVASMLEGLVAFYVNDEVVMQLGPHWYIQFTNIKLAHEYVKRMTIMLDVIEGGRAMSPKLGDPHDRETGTQ